MMCYVLVALLATACGIAQVDELDEGEIIDQTTNTVEVQPSEDDVTVQQTAASEIGQPERSEDYQDYEFVSLDPVVMRLNEAIAKMPMLQTTTADPAWLGFIPMTGRIGYFQFSFHDEQYWFEYMLFPEVQLPLEKAVREELTAHGLEATTVDLNGYSYIEAPLGGDPDQAIEIGIDIIMRVSEVAPDVKVEWISEGI